MSLDIAIVGMSCRFPQSPDVVTFWQNCLQRRDCLMDLGNHRWNHDQFYSPDKRKRNHSHTQRAGLIHDIDVFASRHFQISPRRGRVMDPQQRLTLELAREALQDAGAERKEFDRERSAVFLGASISEFNAYTSLKIRAHQFAEGEFGEPRSDVSAALPDVNAYSLSGALVNMIATNVAHFFKLGGPALTSDSACASSLVAVIQACQYLRSLPARDVRSPLAITGGVYLMVGPDNSVGFAKGSALAQSECRPFDADADGFILGEGAGLCVLKRLEDAKQDGDRIYAVIRSAVWNNDAGTSSVMAPSQEGQARLLRWGLEAAGTDPAEVGYVECQGTGAPTGDAVEIAALSEVWSGERKPVLGSVKANIGHTLTAAGAAGMIRAVMALHTRTFPPQAAWESWHPNLQEYSSRFRILKEPEPWQGKAVATVSAFGFGGTNGFLVLEGAPGLPPSPPRGPYFLPVSAPSLSLLLEHLVRLQEVRAELDSVSHALRLRLPQEVTLLARVGSREQWESIASDLANLTEEVQNVVQKEHYLVGPTEKLLEKALPGWETELAWLKSEEPVKEQSQPSTLPPSLLVRRSLWPVERLPGPRSS